MAYSAPPRLMNREPEPAERRLALEVRSWKLGYAILEGDDLLDWGVCRFPPGEPTAALERIGFLMRTYAPSLVVTRAVRSVRDQSSRNAARVLRNVRRELKRISVQCIVVARRTVDHYFSGLGCRNKNEIAAAVASRIALLGPRQPRARKPWNPESAIVVVFDAIATSLAFDSFIETIP